jgi:hypothetical protein
VLQDQARELAIRVQNELGTDGWEVLYHDSRDPRVHRVHPPGSWPAETWEQHLLGYPPPDPRKGYDGDYTYPEPLEEADEEALILYWLRKDQQQTGTDRSTAAES